MMNNQKPFQKAQFMQIISHNIQQHSSKSSIFIYIMEINLNILQNLIRRPSSRGPLPLSSLFPIDGEEKAQKVVNHPAAKQLWSMIQAINFYTPLNTISKRIPQLFRELIELSVCEVQKSVCAKLVKPGETIVECYDCRVDESCIICMQCFKNGNHKGHKVVFKRAGGGCCDCGDTQAWKEEGFCNKHSGKEKEIVIDELEIKKTNQMLFQLFYLYTFLKLSGNKASKYFFQGFFNVLNKMVCNGLKGMRLVATFLNSQLPKKLTVCSKINGKILQQLMNIQFTGADFRQWQNLFIEMFPFYNFKQQLIASYVKCFNQLYAGQSQTGLSISCQIITSYKLVEDYADSNGAVPILVNPTQNISQLQHATRMYVYDLDKITSLQGNAPFKYWKMQIKYGVQGLFAYYQTLKMLARKQKQKAQESAQKQQQKMKLKKGKQSKISKRKKKQLKKAEQQQQSSSDQEDASFQILDFLKRHNKLIEFEHSILEQFLHILPLIAKDEQLLNLLIKDLTTLIVKQITLQDDLIIFRPFERMLALVFFHLSKQTPFVLTGAQLRQQIRIASGLNEQRWSWLLNKIQERMIQTLTFYGYLQTHENQNYHHIFYVFIVLYCSNLYLLGYTDILAIREIMLLGAPQSTLDFASLAKLKLYQGDQKWNLKIVQNLFTELGLIYTGHFSEIYISHYSLNSNVPIWIEEQTKVLLRKFITSLGGSANFQKIQQFSNGFITNNEDTIKKYLKILCNFNKQKKMFELLPHFVDKTNPINFKDFGIRAKNLYQSSQPLSPSSTLQFIDKENKNILALLWNQNNIESLCSILLQIIDQILSKKSKDELISFYSIPCKLSLFLKTSDVSSQKFTPLTQLLQNLDVAPEIRKALGTLASQLSPIIQNIEMNEQQAVAEKQLQKQRKLKKLEQLKKRKTQNIQKIKEIHELSPSKVQNASQECAICRKTGGNLVWVSRLGIKNLERILNLGDGVLTLSFTSCYHAFDYECILQNSIRRSSHQVLFRCPVCRSLGNVLINLNLTSEQQVYIDAILDRILQVTMTLRNYRQFNIIQQLLKAFYNYVLIGYAEPQYTNQKRLKLYKQIISLLINLKDQSRIDETQKNLQQRKIVLRPKVVGEPKQKIDLKEVEVRELQSYSDSQFSDDELEIWMIDRNRKIKEEKEKIEQEINKKTKEVPKKEQEQYSKLFYYTLKRVIKHIKSKRFQNPNQQIKLIQPMLNENQPEKKSQKMDMQSQKNKVQQIDTQQIPEWAISLLDKLLDEKQKMQAEWTPPQLIKVNLLPEKYYWDMTQNTCDQCNNMCNDFFVCLLCQWKGCLYSCKKGGLKKHNKNCHGQNGAFLRLKDAIVYIMTPGEIKKVGCLYMNEWGEEFNIKKDWGSFYLQTSVIDQTVSMLIRDE